MATYNQQWRAPVDRSSGIAAGALANNAYLASSAVANQTNLEDVLEGELLWSYAIAPTVSTRIDLFILYAVDGTNYEEGGVGAAPIKSLALSFTVIADTNAHRAHFALDLIHPFPFKVILFNNATGQTATVTLLLKTTGMKMVQA